MAGITRMPCACALLKLWLMLVFWLALAVNWLQEEEPLEPLGPSGLPEPPQNRPGLVTQTQIDAVTTVSRFRTAEPIGW